MHLHPHGVNSLFLDLRWGLILSENVSTVIFVRTSSSPNSRQGLGLLGKPTQVDIAARYRILLASQMALAGQSAVFCSLWGLPKADQQGAVGEFLGSGWLDLKSDFQSFNYWLRT